MKHLRRIGFTILLFLVILVSLSTGGEGAFTKNQGFAPVLARVEVTGMLNDLGLPVNAHLKDSSGKDYALVIATPSQLEKSGAAYRILDRNADQAEYFILYTMSSDKREMAKLPDNMLLNDGKHIVVRSNFNQVEKLAESGYDIQRLDHKPMILTPLKKYPESKEMTLTYDSVIATMIGQVSQTSIQTLTQNLSGVNAVSIGGSNYTIATRHTSSGTPVSKATQYVYEYLQNLGLTVSYHNWTYSTYSSRNVIAEKTGSVLPNEIVLITAHIDDMPSGTTAPGADDNASGTVGVLTCAQLLNQQQFQRTIRFVLFTGEEQGLLGSEAYSDLVYSNGNNVVAVLNMDMISYDGTGSPYMRLHTRTSSNSGYSNDLAIANTFVDVVNSYGLSSGLSPVITSDGESRSDHSSFWGNGYPGVLCIEDHINDISPYYHLTTDTVSTLNYTYYTNFVKAAVGTASHLAIRYDGTVSAAFTASATSGTAPLAVTFTNQSIGSTSWAWDFGDGSTSTSQNPSHNYTTAGTYTVALTATGTNGSDTETKTNYITVSAPAAPVAAFTASATSTTINTSITFTDQSANTPTSWSWNFGDGSTSTLQNPSHAYTTAGTYSVSLTATNAQGSNTLTKSSYITVSSVSYCTSASTDYSDEYIKTVKFGTTSNTSAGSYYTDYTSVVFNLTRGASVSFTLTPGFTGTSYTEYWKVWIDYNKDGDFADTGEQIYSGSGKTAKTSTFTVSSTASTGATRMRVSMKYGSTPTYCGSFNYGEVEDYTANIQ